VAVVACAVAGVLLLAPPALSVPNTWTATGSLTTARLQHTATLLPGGKVLVAGGAGSNNDALASAELFDPAAGTWTATGSLSTARARPTATLLSDGKVLVAGGAVSLGNTLASAELYDPATGSWIATGPLTTARVDHTATLLPSGKVLVAGGAGPTGVLASAELYDPATGTWSATGSMQTPGPTPRRPCFRPGRCWSRAASQARWRVQSCMTPRPAAGARPGR